MLLGVLQSADTVIEPISNVAFQALSAVGTAAFGVSGAAAAMRANMDWVGVIVLALLTAVGGGSLRDVVLNDLPMWWITDWWVLIVATAAAVLLIAMRGRVGHLGDPDSWRTVLIADALGLAAFCVTGAAIALRLGFAPWVAILMGVLTATGGGVLRDVLANIKPVVLTGAVYATAALVGSVLFVILKEAGWPEVPRYWIPMALAFGLRFIALRRRWEFAPVSLAEEKESEGPQQQGA